jgi:hypothetical protein
VLLYKNQRRNFHTACSAALFIFGSQRSSQVLYGEGRITYYLPSKKIAHFAQGACVSIPKHNDILDDNDKVFLVAPK